MISHLSIKIFLSQVIAVYRSSNSQLGVEHITSLASEDKGVIICGDFNLCFREKTSHSVIKYLLSLKFEQKVTEATHIEGGLIDHVYFRKGCKKQEVDVQLYSPYYTASDHDALCVTVGNLSD